MNTSSSSHRSIFQHITSTELNGFRVRKRPCFAEDTPRFTRIAGMDYGVDEDISPPMAVSFCKTSKNAHILGVSGEDGYICLYNTRLKFDDSATTAENAEKARVSEWLAHDNAVFDLCWIKDDTNLLTACGDHSIKVWDVQAKKSISILTGHTGSVKSISAHPSNNDVIVSGSRDGSVALWDLRGYQRENASTLNIATVQGAHTFSHKKMRTRLGKAASMSVTSVLYLKDEISIATAGAADSVIKFWDTRNLKAPITQACSQNNPDDKRTWARSYGISSLSQDLNGVYISASCMDNRIYLYNVLQFDKGPIKSFSGCDIGTFFVKSKLSPDAGHILSGSSDGSAYVWQVDKPQADPIKLEGHEGEVTAVDWSSHEIGKIATSADDSVVQLWNINSSCYSNTRSSSSIRRRETFPRMQRRKLFTEEEPKESIKEDQLEPPIEPSVQIHLPTPASPEMRTPESIRKQSPNSNILQTCERSPDSTFAAFGSPSSVLNPPPSLKRKTILDYFVAPST